MKYRIKPHLVEAILYDGNNTVDVLNFASNTGPYPLWGHDFTVNTIKRRVSFLKEDNSDYYHVKPGTYIVCNLESGAFYPMSKSKFSSLYELAESN